MRMKAHNTARALMSALLAALLLAATACGGAVLDRVTQGDFTYTLYGQNDKVSRIVVTRDGKEIGTYTKSGLRGDTVENYGFALVDLNFDGQLDMKLETAKKEAGVQSACYLWDEDKDCYVYHSGLSALQELSVDPALSALTAREYRYTVDPATGDTPEFYTRYEAFVLYLFTDGKLTEVHRKELTYYEESDIYCYAVLDRSESGEMETTRESWITAERFDPDQCPLDTTGYAAP